MVIFTLIAVILLPFAVPVAVKAATSTESSKDYIDTTQTKIIYDEDGGYFVEILEDTLPLLDSFKLSANARSTTTTKTKTKTIKYYKKSVLCWKYSLTATFSIRLGSSVTYKSSKASLVNSNDWSVVSERHSGSKEKATGTIKMKKNNTVISRTVTICCDKNGHFS